MKEVIGISDTTTCVDLFEEISAKSPKLLEETLVGIVNNTISPQKQCEDGVCFANKLEKEECLIDWNKDATTIHNLVRGVYKFPCAYFVHNDKIIKVLETKVCQNSGSAGEFIKADKNGVEIACGANSSLLLIKVKPEGKGEMLARDWYNGLKK